MINCSDLRSTLNSQYRIAVFAYDTAKSPDYRGLFSCHNMIMPLPIRAVLFDAGGVIVHPYRFRAWPGREHAITPAMTVPFFDGVFSRQCLVGQADLADALRP